ncbi:hypothetical protein OIA45_49180 (plasmid) [Streptomyces chartreusis]|uniref:hypothetical protein n=1 Tax=Streptomyces chartreusis TaxID=1969 RepID=UPI0037DC5611|nr:hypothetical protein OIA45_49180 [Streptomyces chartreusis]
MRVHTTAPAVALLALALTACSSSDDKPSAPAWTTAPATPSAAATQACEDAWLKTMDSSKDAVLPEDPPAACALIPGAARNELWLKAHNAWLARNRECNTDPSCTLLPEP